MASSSKRRRCSVSLFNSQSVFTPPVTRFLEIFYFVLINLIKIIDVLHPGRPNVSKVCGAEGKLSRMYEVKDPNAISVFQVPDPFWRRQIYWFWFDL
ncbi:hypothetical protein CsSME_00038219 [Camellia sinensis var. sinensis]